MNGALQQHHSIKEVPLWPVAGQDFGGLASGLYVSSNWVFMLTTDADGGNVSSPLPPFDHSGFNVSINDHLALSLLFVKQLNSSARSYSLFDNKKDVTSTLKNITESITNSIMRSNLEYAALGVTWHQEPSLQIQWGWLVLPIALVVCSTILLISVMVASRHFHAPQWKSSPLPFLYHGLQKWEINEEDDLLAGRLESVHAMENRAKTKRVRILTSPKGGRWLTE